MNIGKEIVAYVKTVSGITDLIGTGSDCRIYARQLPQEADNFPAITYTRISRKRMYSQSGDSLLTTVRVQLSCWAETYTAVDGLAAAVITAFSGFSGTMGAATVKSSFIENDFDLPEPDTGIYQVPVDIMITYNG